MTNIILKQTVRPPRLADVQTYIHRKGYLIVETFYKELDGKQVATHDQWRKDSHGIQVVASEQWIDYPHRIAETIVLLAELENRSELDVYYDIVCRPW